MSSPLARAAIVLAMLTGYSAAAAAQDPVSTDYFRFQPQQTYVQFEPFEWFNPQTLNIVLKFTDLVLPGNNGHELRFVRTFDNNPLNVFGRAAGWVVGPEGIPLRIMGSCFMCNPGQPFDNDNPDAYVITAPAVLTADGAVKQMFYMNTPQTGNAASQRWVETIDNWKYDQQENKLYLDDGSICDFEAIALAQYRLTTCSDAYGLFLSVSYSGPSTTYTQHLDDGRADRQVTIGPGPDGTTQLTYDGRTWSSSLTSAVMPDGSAWGFAYGAEHGLLTQIVTPWGGEIDYTYDSPSSVESVWFETCGCWDYLTVYHGPFLSTRRTVDNGVTTGTWTMGNFFFVPGANDSLPESYTLTRPSGPSMTFGLCLHDFLSGLSEYSRIAGSNHGVCGVSLGPSRSTVFHYQLVSYRAHLMRFVLDRSDVVDCDAPNACTFHRTAYTYDPLFNVESETETNLDHPGSTRVTTRTYLNRHYASESRNFAGLITSHSVTIGADTISRSWVRNGDTGFITSVTSAGITTTYQPDAHGNIGTATTATGHDTTYSHERGVVKDTTTPAYTVSRVIRDDGLVLSETMAGRTTTYGYDPVGRRTSVQGPGTVSPIITTYAPAARTTTVTQGPSVVTTTLDGFGRAIGTANTVGTQTRTAYDGEGRTAYQSLPFGNGVAEVGTTFTYDDANRVTREAHADGSFVRRVYSRSGVTVYDENDRATVITSETFGNPDVARTVAVLDPNNNLWQYAYDASDTLRAVSGPDSVSRTWSYYAGTQLLFEEAHPESGTTSYLQYYPDGLLQQKRDANQTVFDYTYDNKGRLWTVTATPAPGMGPVSHTTITYETGSDLRKTATVDGVTSVFDYDGAGRLHQRADTVDGKAFIVIYDYDARNNVTDITYPTGRHVKIDYDPENRITRVYNGLTDETYATEFQYEPSGALKQYRAGNGVLTTLAYDPNRQWLSTLVVGSGSNRLDFAYGYDPVGNVKDIVDGTRAQWVQHFDYDPLDRLTAATSQGAYGALGYTYDAHGNRQTAGSTTYTYDPANLFRLKQINGGFNLTYDNNGNLTGGFGGTYVYTPTNQASSAVVNGVTTYYAYDADQWRLKKAVGADPVVYAIRGPNGQLLSEWTNSAPATVRDYIYAGGRLIGVMTTHQPPK